LHCKRASVRSVGTGRAFELSVAERRLEAARWDGDGDFERSVRAGEGLGPELTAADLTEEQNHWLEQELSSAAGAVQTAEDKLVVTDLAERLLETLSPEDRLALTLIDAAMHHRAQCGDVVCKTPKIPGKAPK